MLQRTYRVLVLDSKVVLDVLLENDDRVGILFGPTGRAFIGRFKPSEDALRVKSMCARKTLRAL